MDAKPAPNTYTTAAGAQEGPAGSNPVFPMPVAVLVARGFQLFIGFIIIILSGLLIHGLALDAIVFALVCGLFTFVVVLYALLTEKVPDCRSGYNFWAILALDAFMVVMWLSSMAAVAALRATFTVAVDASCWDDGSAINAGHCIVDKRSLERRDAVANKGGLAEMSAIAGLSALEMLLFVGTLAYLGHQIRLHNQTAATTVSSDNATVEMKAQTQPMLGQQQVPLQQQQQAHFANGQQQPAYAAQQVYPQQTGTPQPQMMQQQQAPYDAYSYGQQAQQQVPQQQQQVYQQQQQYPSQSQTPVSAEHYAQYQQTGQVQQQQPQMNMYSPAGTPAPQNPYHPPQ